MKTQHHIITRAVLLLLALVVAGITASAVTVTLWSVKGNGKSAEAQFSDTTGGGRINLYQNGGQTFMFYEIWGYEPTSEYCTDTTDEFGNTITVCRFTLFNYDYGWGLIPSSDIEFTATNAHLVTNFSGTRCTTDSAGVTPTTTCASYIEGFDLTWSLNNVSTNSTSGVNQNAFRSFTFTSEGKVLAISAFVNGYVTGRQLINAPGRLGDTKVKNVATVVVP